MNKKVSYTNGKCDNGKCDNATLLYAVTTSMVLIEYDVSIDSSGGVRSKQGEQHQQFRLVLLPKQKVQQTTLACMRCNKRGQQLFATTFSRRTRLSTWRFQQLCDF